jgi:exodeoxyribonuclease VII small subunit
VSPPDDIPAAASLDGIGYADAVAELEEILEQLDGDEIDVDHLAAQVRRAAELIALCRSRLSAARMEVTRIVADLDATSAVPGPDDRDAASTGGSEAGTADEPDDDGFDDLGLDDLARDDT